MVFCILMAIPLAGVSGFLWWRVVEGIRYGDYDAADMIGLCTSGLVITGFFAACVQQIVDLAG